MAACAFLPAHYCVLLTLPPRILRHAAAAPSVDAPLLPAVVLAVLVAVAAAAVIVAALCWRLLFGCPAAFEQIVWQTRAAGGGVGGGGAPNHTGKSHLLLPLLSLALALELLPVALEIARSDTPPRQNSGSRE